MSDVDVKKSPETSSEGGQSVEKQQQGGSRLARGGDLLSNFWNSPDLFSRNPFALMRRMGEEMDRTFGQLFGQAAGGGGGWYPAIDVSEQNGQLQVHAELPGLKPEDVKVELTDNSLIIRGERKSQREHQIGKAYRSERRYGEFYREIPLPEGTKADEAKAQFRDGVLEITVPLPPQTSGRREIPVQSGT